MRSGPDCRNGEIGGKIAFEIAGGVCFYLIAINTDGYLLAAAEAGTINGNRFTQCPGRGAENNLRRNNLL